MKTAPTLKIMVVDDDAIFRTLADRFLRIVGCKDILLLESGPLCLDRLTPEFDLIFLDYDMGIYNGIETLKKIKRLNPNVPVVFISGQDDVATAVNALKFGAFDYILKSQLSAQRLKITVEKVLLFREILQKRAMKNSFRKILGAIGAGSLSALLFKASR